MFSSSSSILSSSSLRFVNITNKLKLNKKSFINNNIHQKRNYQDCPFLKEEHLMISSLTKQFSDTDIDDDNILEKEVEADEREVTIYTSNTI